MPNPRKSLALIDKECETLETDLLNPEITDKEGVLKALEGNTADWLTKINNIGRLLDWWRREQAFVKSHIKYLKENLDVMEERDKWIRQATINSMVRKNEKTLRFPEVTVYWQDLDDEIIVEDEKLIPDEFQKLVPSHYEIDLSKLKEHIRKTGEIVSGTKITRNRKSLTVRSH